MGWTLLVRPVGGDVDATPVATAITVAVPSTGRRINIGRSPEACPEVAGTKVLELLDSDSLDTIQAVHLEVRCEPSDPSVARVRAYADDCFSDEVAVPRDEWHLVRVGEVVTIAGVLELEFQRDEGVR